MSSVSLRRTLSAAALVALGLSALATPAVADPLVPETREQARILGGASAGADVTSEDESNGSIAPGGVPFVPMDFTAPLAFGQEKATPNVELVKNVPLQEGQATMSNLAFKGDYVYQGSYNGFVAYDVSNPEDPQVVSNTICPGYQGDLSIAGDLLFFSVDQPRNGSECGAAAVAASNAAAWEGIRIFDISNPASPQYVGNVKTRCGSHTHTLVPKPGDDNSVYLYNAAYDVSASAFYCKPPHQQLEIIEVDLDDPAGAHIAKEVSLWDAENPAFTTADRVDGGAATSTTNGCHDLTAYPAKGLLAAACMGDGVMVDISDPLNPAVTERVRDENYAFWHTAQFSDDASKVVFQDELGGGSSATCLPGTPQYRGANAIFSIEGDDLTLRSYYKIPRRQSTRENCVGHEGNIVQVGDRDVMVQAWYQGGASLIDFSNQTKPQEIGYFDRGSLGENNLVLGGYWAVYHHNGYLYGSEIGRGLDVLKLKGDEFADAVRHRQDVRNPATQEPITWDWKTAPVVPSLGSLPEAEVSPASFRAGTDRDVTVSVPAGTFDDGEYVDVWSTGDDAEVLATGRAEADGSASLTVTVPASAKVGMRSFVVRGDSELDEALYAASVELTAVSTSTALSVSPKSQVFGSNPATLTATVTGEGAEGTVTFSHGGGVIARGVALSGGKAGVRLPRDFPVAKRHALRAAFVPSSSGSTASTSSVVSFDVLKATAKVKAASVTKVKASKRGKLTVKVTATGTTPTGKVTVTVGGKKTGGVLRNGAVTITLPKLKAGTYRATVAYGGSASVSAKSAKVTIRVTR